MISIVVEETRAEDEPNRPRYFRAALVEHEGTADGSKKELCRGVFMKSESQAVRSLMLAVMDRKDVCEALVSHTGWIDMVRAAESKAEAHDKAPSRRRIDSSMPTSGYRICDECEWVAETCMCDPPLVWWSTAARQWVVLGNDGRRFQASYVELTGRHVDLQQRAHLSPERVRKIARGTALPDAFIVVRGMCLDVRVSDDMAVFVEREVKP